MFGVGLFGKRDFAVDGGVNVGFVVGDGLGYGRAYDADVDVLGFWRGMASTALDAPGAL